MARTQAKFAIMAIDYFTKWVEVEPLSTITKAKCTSFIWKNIIFRFGVPHFIVTENEKQFDNPALKEMYQELSIRKLFSTPGHPQANGQVEAANKTIKDNLKMKLECLKRAWADELPMVLWAHRTTPKGATGETSFSLVFGTEAVILAEVKLLSYRVENFIEQDNGVALLENLDFLEEKRDHSLIQSATQKQLVAKYYNVKVRPRSFLPGDLVLRRVFRNTQEHEIGSFGPNWEGPYKVVRVVRTCVYELEDLGGKPLSHLWNAEHLRKYF